MTGILQLHFPDSLNMRSKQICTLLLLGLGMVCYSQSAAFDPIQPQKRMIPARFTGTLEIDGKLNEPAWDSATTIDDFIEVNPDQGKAPSERTIVKLLYNNNYLFIAAINLDHEGKRSIRVPDFKRDFDTYNHDIFGIVLDGFHDARNAMVFITNPYGVQRDALVFDDRFFDQEWDGLWKVRTQQTDSGWIAEIALPWKTLRYPPIQSSFQTWGINFCRQRRSSNQLFAWSPFPRAYNWTRMTYEGLLDSIPVPPARTNIRLLPYTLTSIEKSHSHQPVQTSVKLGGEVKWAIKPNKVLDLTFNTDFAQADVDQLVNNLERYSIFFPERRQFFLENAGFFNTGLNLNPDGNKETSMTIQPFFSRRIGLDNDGNPLPILAGARYVQRGDKQNLGLIAIRQAASDSMATVNFFTGRYTRNIGKSNQVGVLVTSRMQENGDTKPSSGYTNWSATIDGFSRISQKLQWNGMVSGTSNSGKEEKGLAAYSQLFYRDDFITAWWNEALVSRDYNPEMGFVNRRNVITTSYGFYLAARWKWLPKFVRSFGPGFANDILHSVTTGKVEETSFNVYPVWFNLHSGGWAGLSWRYQFQDLKELFEPLGAKIAPGKYRYDMTTLWAGTNGSKKVSLELQYIWGTYYDGRLHNGKIYARYSPIPHLSFNAGFEQYHIGNLGIEQKSTTSYLYNWQARLSLNPRVQASFLFQKNTSNGSNGINAKFSWEYRPLSFIYLVYNSRSYLANSIQDRSQLGILKFSYLRQF